MEQGVRLQGYITLRGECLTHLTSLTFDAQMNLHFKY